MAILLTGGLGYIGSHIAHKLKQKAIIIDNKSNSSLNYRKKLPLSIVYCLDLNYRNLKKIFSKHNIQGVIHLAGLKSVNNSTNLPLQYYRNNVYSSLELLECMDRFKIRKLIFSSSATVYGNQHSSPLKEHYSLNSTNPYASNKIAIEKMINDYAKSNSNFKAISLRYFNPIGADVEFGLADQPLGKPLNIMPILIESVIKKKKFTVFGNNYETKDGTCLRDYIHVKDLAYAHILALKTLNNTNGHIAINLGIGKGVSVLELIKLFEKANGLKINYKIGKRRVGDSAISYASNLKAKKLLNWKPKYSHKDMLVDSWLSYKNYIK